MASFDSEPCTLSVRSLTRGQSSMPGSNASSIRPCRSSPTSFVRILRMALPVCAVHLPVCVVHLPVCTVHQPGPSEAQVDVDAHLFCDGANAREGDDVGADLGRLRGLGVRKERFAVKRRIWVDVVGCMIGWSGLSFQSGRSSLSARGSPTAPWTMCEPGEG